MGGGKPYDYEVEYLESTGTQYIDLLIYPNIGAFLKCKWCFTDTNANACVNGIGWFDDHRLNFGYGTNGNIGAASGNWTWFESKNTNVHEVIIDEVSKTYQYDNVLYSFSDSRQLESFIYGGFCLFCRNRQYRKDLYCKERIYTFALSSSNCHFDLIPVVDKQGVGYMYDKVSGQLFGNQGTGSFTVGPRVS